MDNLSTRKQIKIDLVFKNQVLLTELFQIVFS